MVPCPPITWSIDTTGVSHPGRTAVAARRAVQAWSDVTGLTLQYTPSGGTIGIVFRAVDARWLAYTMSDSIVVSPVVADATSPYQTEVLAHELGHALGVDHVGVGLMGGYASKPTAADAALVTRCPT